MQKVSNSIHPHLNREPSPSSTTRTLSMLVCRERSELPSVLKPPIFHPRTSFDSSATLQKKIAFVGNSCSQIDGDVPFREGECCLKDQPIDLPSLKSLVAASQSLSKSSTEGLCAPISAAQPATSFIPDSSVTSNSIASTKSLTECSPKSALKKDNAHKPSFRTKKGVRGLWNETDHFSLMHNELLLSILSYTTATEKCRLSMVSRRWNLVSNLEKAWAHVDATELVQDVARHFHQDSASVSATLSHELNKHSPEKLTIRGIGRLICPDQYLPSITGLRELTLGNFEGLTDTHVHVMLLGVADGQARSKNTNCLRKLALEDCPLLTSTVVQSIAKHCPNLEELSLQGCEEISDLTPLRIRWKRVDIPAPKVADTPLGGLFAPPPVQQKPLKPALASLFAQPAGTNGSHQNTLKLVQQQPPSPPRAKSLQSLFAPPGTSPPRQARSISLPSLSSLTGPPSLDEMSGRLHSLNASRTSVCPAALLDSISVSDESVVELSWLSLLDNSTAWHETHLLRLEQLIDVKKLLHLEVTLVPPTPTSTASSSSSALLHDLLQRSRQAAVKLRSKCIVDAPLLY